MLANKTPPRTKYNVPAFEHGLDLLELILESPQPLAQKTIASRANKPVSSVFRLLNCLEQRGYIQRDTESGAYSPTMHLYTLAHTCPAHQRFREVASAPMRELAEQIGESCHLSIREGNAVRVIFNQPSPYMHSLNVSEDNTYSLIGTTAGRLLLAHMGDTARTKVLNGLSDYQNLVDEERVAFVEAMQSLERKHLVTTPSQQTPGVLDIDCLLKNVWLGADAVLAVPCIQKWSKAEQKQKLHPAIEATAKQVTLLLQEH